MINCWHKRGGKVETIVSRFNNIEAGAYKEVSKAKGQRDHLNKSQVSR